MRGSFGLRGSLLWTTGVQEQCDNVLNESLPVLWNEKQKLRDAKLETEQGKVARDELEKSGRKYCCWLWTAEATVNGPLKGRT